MNNGTALVALHEVSKLFKKQKTPALNQIEAAIPKKKIVGLCGPDGSGKTTLIRLITGLLKPTIGSVTVAGYDTVRDAELVSALIGYMPQRFGLYEDLTVQQNLELYAELKGVKKEDRPGTFKRLLSFTGLAPFVDRRAQALSGGMKQKLGLACALISKPALLLLDEPSVGVDPISRRELWKMVLDLVHEDVTVIWSTSYLDEAERCDTVILLNEGKLLYQGAPQGLTERMAGRVFRISCSEQTRRGLLTRASQNKQVIDSTIQGSDIRIVMREKEQQPSTDLCSSLKVTAAPPRFEDAFVDLLGGSQNGGVSILAEHTPQLPSTHEVVVQAKQLTKRFGSFIAAREINFEVRQGEIFGLLGPNGAGKSTTFKMMCGLLRPTAGKALVMGLDLQEAPGQARSRIGYMAQKFSLYGNLSVSQNLEFFSGIYNLTGATKREAIELMIDIFDLPPFLNELADNLPLGFKQRLALSCSVMHHPEVLFLDEPTSGVDPLTRREFWSHINGLVGKGVTVMVTTHFMDEAEYCDRIGLVYQSRLIKLGTPDELKRDCATPENPEPTLEEAFVQLIDRYARDNHGSH